MQNFRQFEAGPDPFGRTWDVLFKWMQTAIALRHSDTVDVKFILRNGETQMEKTIALPHAELAAVAKKTGRTMTDAWCSRLAATHLLRMVATGEDMEKETVQVTPGQLAEYAAGVEG